MICAGTYLDWLKVVCIFTNFILKVNHASKFDPRLLAIVPPLIGLKGNLEVTLSSRLSTVVCHSLTVVISR